MYKVITAKTAESLTSLLNTHEQSGWRVTYQTFKMGDFIVTLHREEEWYQPFLMACETEGQADLVRALVRSLEVAANPQIVSHERVRQVRALIAPYVKAHNQSNGNGQGYKATAVSSSTSEKR